MRLTAAYLAALVLSQLAAGATYSATPATYNTILPTLLSGDTLVLAPGNYPLLKINGLNGTPQAWITITGPTSGPPVIIYASSACCNVIEILNSSFVALENLQIDSRGIAGIFGVSAKGGTSNLVHDILVEGNVFVGQNGSQQTDAISTKTPTWGWIIRGNTITGAGTGLYLGNSDGSDPFIGGLIENNLIQNTVGYNAEIKYQTPRPSVPGMPTGQSVTIIRNNVFIKDDQASPDGNRPNLLVGGFPSTGAGSTDWYEVYGNFFDHNPRESLFQASGRVTIHDNVFVDGQYSALALQNQDLPLKTAYVYNNTIYSSQAGITFGSAASIDDSVTGNLIFAAIPITGPIAHASNNMVDTVANGVLYVAAPSFTLGAMNFYPLTGKSQGTAIDLSKFTFDTDYSLDFNGVSKTAAEGSVVFRGAYGGAGDNPGWQLQSGIKPQVTAKFSDIAIFRPPAAVGGALGFFTLDSNGNYAFDMTDKTRQFGLAGDYPVAGDWDGNGTIKLGVFRCPAPGADVCTWYLDDNNNGVWDGIFAGDVSFQFGLPGDIPVVGDWTGTGVSKVGVMRCPAAGQPGVCTWILDTQNLRAPNGNFLVSSYGLAGDLPAVGNWAGAGGSKPVDNIGVFRNGQWILNSSGSGFWTPTDTQYSYGMPGDVPVTGNWQGAATKRIGVFRCPAGAPGSAVCQWILNTNGSGAFSATDLIAPYGLVGDQPVVGFWTVQ